MISHLRQAIANDLEAGEEQRRFGSGWLSGVLALIIGGAALLLLIGHQYPQRFSVQELQPLHKNLAFNLVIEAMALIAFALAVANLTLRRNKTLGFTAMAFVLLTTTLGAIGAQTLPGAGFHFGVDWFVLNILLKGVLFVPLEKLFSGAHKQPLFRQDWREDLFYFLLTSLFVQTLAFVSLAPAMTVLDHTTGWQPFRDVVAHQPFLLQFIEIVFIADLTQYIFHRMFHQVPFLWRFHAVHHSAQTMDWMAGSKMHLLEVIALRAFTILPLYVLGFAQGPLYGYIFFVYIVSSYVHANLRFNDRWLAMVFVTPRFHHWHHGIEKEAIDVNFSIHFPWIDKLFGTYHMPGDRWPSGYGIGGHPVPKGVWQQFLYPFRRDRSDAAE